MAGVWFNVKHRKVRARKHYEIDKNPDCFLATLALADTERQSVHIQYDVKSRSHAANDFLILHLRIFRYPLARASEMCD